MSHWTARAACAGHPDPDVFTNGHRVAEAQIFCRRCPVVAECRDEGRKASIGTWGGEFHELKSAKSLTLPFLQPAAGQ